MVLRATDDSTFSLLLELTEEALETDVFIDGVILLASEGVRTRGHLNVSISESDIIPSNYFVIAIYSLTDTSEIMDPIEWMHAGNVTTFSFASFLASILNL